MTTAFGQRSEAHKSYHGVSIAFVVISFVFVILFFTNRKLYYFLLLEDGLMEWLTFAGLFTSSILSLRIALGINKKYHYTHWFFFLFFAFALLAGMEEISWGQRIFDIESNAFFTKYNDQQETNLHNTFQGVAGIKTKHIALLVLFIYGVILPIAVQKGKLQLNWIKEKSISIPPLFLSLPFLIATAFMIDFPTGMEEEIGEFFYSVCFVFWMAHNVALYKKGAFSRSLKKQQSLKGF
jgi:hypothetical protein